MKKKVLKSALAAALVVTISLSGVAPVTAANSSKAINQSIENQKNDSMKELKFSDKALEASSIPEQTFNVMDRQSEKKIQVENGMSLYRKERAATSNTDPNHALAVQNDMISQGNIEEQGEMRWYKFEIKKRSTITIFLQMVETLDVDIELYSLDQKTATLNRIGGSANIGVAKNELAKYALDAGVYYFAVAAYEGTGAFAFQYFESSADAKYEVNDRLADATEIKLARDITGVIDSSFDVDFYVLTIDEPKIMDYNITTKDGYSLVYLGELGDEAAVYPGYQGTQFSKFMPGTYYFGVNSTDHKYSATSTYAIRFREIGKVAEDEGLQEICFNSDAKVVLQANADRSVCYVNGAKIDINYSYKYSLSNSAGTQEYDLSIDHRNDVYAFTEQWNEFSPEIVYYNSSTKPAMKVDSKPALLLTFWSTNNFYKIHCSCTGAYRNNSMWKDLNVVSVLVDPDTGKVIDIYRYNYFYEHVRDSNEIIVTSPYRTNFVIKQQ